MYAQSLAPPQTREHPKNCMAGMQNYMEWQTIKFDWNHAKAFLVTAEEGSFTAAANALNTTQPTLGRQVTALEEELGVILFDRVAGRLKLTRCGMQLLEYVRQMADSAGHISRLAEGQSTQVKGKVIVSASEVYCAHLLPPIIKSIRTVAPGITVEIIADNQPSDLTRREADIAIRNFRPEEPELIARKIRDDQGCLYATPGYLQNISNPDDPASFTNATFIAFADIALLENWLNTAGIPITSENFKLIARNYLVHWELVKQGLGIGIMPQDIGDAEPTVVRACPFLDPFVFPVWLVSHRELKTSTRVRVVFDLIAEALQHA